MRGLKRDMKRYCKYYAMNESLFGQSRGQLENMEREMGIELDLDFSHCYLILTGLPKWIYMERLGMCREDLLSQLDALEEKLCSLALEENFSCEGTVLNYDSSKRLLVAVSPKGELDVSALAERLGGFIEADYARLSPGKSLTTRNITVYSQRIDSYEGYQSAFAQLQALYDRAFFLRELDVFNAEQADQRRMPTSMVEAERTLARLSDCLFLRDRAGAEECLLELFLEQLKPAQDRLLCAEVLVLLKKQLDDLSLILGSTAAQESSGGLELERFLCVEELYRSVCELVERLLSDSRFPPLRPDSLTIRAARFIREHYYEPLDLTTLAERLHVNPSYLSHLFKQEMGVGLTRYITRIRLEQAQRLLRETNLKITEIAHNVGFDDPRYFNTVFKRHTGVTPTAYREKVGFHSN